jgi:hypothetical protein
MPNLTSVRGGRSDSASSLVRSRAATFAGVWPRVLLHDASCRLCRHNFLSHSSDGPSVVAAASWRLGLATGFVLRVRSGSAVPRRYDENNRGVLD